MNHYFEVNNYLVADRRSFPESSVVFENAWGVADEVLYSNAIDVINHRPKGRPFFAHIMTTSNHRPYTYPDGRIDIPSPGGRAGAVKYTDYALGKFIEDAKKQPWFGDTLFVITADHCASVAGKTKLPVKNYRIPLIFYAPEIVRPSTFDPIVSQIDLMPTLIEVLGKKGDDHFFGRSFFEDGTNPERAFISNYQELGYLRGGILTVLLPHKKVEFYQVGLDLETQTAIPANTRYLREAIAYYQTASRAFKSGALTVAPRR
jgi:phosphoglycerol transferase MdoB-like AlkP superfamily enzyme